MNAMYKAFTQKLKSTPVRTSTDPLVIVPWNSDSDDVPVKARENIFIETTMVVPLKVVTMPLLDVVKRRPVVNSDFYHEPFIFKESERDVRDLVASSFTARIRVYDIPYGIKVPTNLRTYDGTTDPDDHLTVFIGTIDVHKLQEPSWCRFFHITLCGAARFWYNNLTPGSIDGFHQLRDKFRANFLQQRRFQKTEAEILDIRQRPNESLKDYVAQFSKETLHMVGRSDVMVFGAFISGMRPGRLFKDLIAKPLTSLEDLFTQTNNFIRAEDANNENRLREPRRETKQHVTYKDLPRRNKDKHVSRSASRHMESPRFPREAFTALIKSPSKILATSEGKSMLRPPPRMFTPASKRDQTRYCEFHEDHGHETNDCIDLRKEIKACVRSGRLAHLAKGAKTHNNNQNTQTSRSKDVRNVQIEWNKKESADAKPKNEIHMIRITGTNPKKTRVSFPRITFFEDDPIPEHCTGDGPLIITADIGTTQIHRVYVDGGSSTEIMYEHCFEQLTAEEKKTIRPSTTQLVGFAGQVSWPLGLITLPITLHDYRGHISKTVMGGIAIIKGEKFHPNVCNHISQKRCQPERAKGTEDAEHVVINDAHSDQTITIAANLPKTLKEKLCELLRSNKDVFAWTPADMTGIPWELAEHKLNIHPRTFPVWQKKRAIAKERSEAITTEVSKLVEARILKAVFFPKWLSNPVMVKKTDGTWRMCIDFTSLNKACPKDSYPLPEMDQKYAARATHMQGSMKTITRPLGSSKICREIFAFLQNAEGMPKQERFPLERRSGSGLPGAKKPSLVLTSTNGSEINYPNLEKLALALVLLKPENSGCITKWAIKLGEHEILYKPRSAIKGQILVDFLAESPTINDL
ncbi:reverse transcriptase domain-containing protein [Tanacetum coccineum]